MADAPKSPDQTKLTTRSKDARSKHNIPTSSGHHVNTHKPSTLQKQTTDFSDSTPSLFHRIKHNGSILTLVVSDEHIYVGTQTGEISVWSLATYELVATVNGHRGSVLCLFLSQDRNLLFSSAGDAIVNVSHC